MTTTKRPAWEVYESGYANWEGQDKWHIATVDGKAKGPFDSKAEAQAVAALENARVQNGDQK